MLTTIVYHGKEYSPVSYKIIRGVKDGIRMLYHINDNTIILSIIPKYVQIGFVLSMFHHKGSMGFMDLENVEYNAQGWLFDGCIPVEQVNSRITELIDSYDTYEVNMTLQKLRDYIKPLLN